MLYCHVNDFFVWNGQFFTTRSRLGGIDVKIRKCQVIDLRNRRDTVIYRIVYTMRKYRLNLLVLMRKGI